MNEQDGKKHETPPGKELPELPKAPFCSFGSTPEEASQDFLTVDDLQNETIPDAPPADRGLPDSTDAGGRGSNGKLLATLAETKDK